MPKKTEWITRSEAAARLNVSGSMVSRYVKKGMATRSDKKIPWPDARSWVARFIVPERSGSYAARHRDSATQARGPVQGTTFDARAPWYQGYVAAIEEIFTTEELFRFARFALQSGCTAEQAYMLAQQHVAYAVLALALLDCDDVPNPPEPDWRAVLGKRIDVNAVEAQLERLERLGLQDLQGGECA